MILWKPSGPYWPVALPQTILASFAQYGNDADGCYSIVRYADAATNIYTRIVIILYI